jgi:hypothetical protein
VSDMHSRSSDEITFADHELKWLAKDPTVLRALADRYDVDIAEADAMAGEFPDIQAMIKRQEARKAALNARAEEIERAY